MIIYRADGTEKTVTAALVSDTVESYIPGFIRAMSLSTDGRLRVTTGADSYNFSPWGHPETFESHTSYPVRSAWG